MQLATPSRERVESYKVMREDIERQVGHINGEYGEVGPPGGALPAPADPAR